MPELRGSEVLVRIRCATICGSDLHTCFGRRAAPTPSVLGHEMVGDIEAIGPAGAAEFQGGALQPGDRVTWSMVWSCGGCFFCELGLPAKCERLRKFGHEPLQPGRELFGGFAERCLLPEGTAILRVPSNLADVVASPANCATATVAAVLGEAGGVAGKTLVIAGAGMLGLTACAMAAEGGARQVIAVERDPARARRAVEFGACVVLDGSASAAELRREVGERTDGRGADAVMDFTGSPDAMEAGWQLLRPGGTLLLAGAVFPARPVAWPAEEVVRRWLRIRGVYNYAPRDLRAALEFLAGAGHRYPFASLVGREFPLRRIQEALAFAEVERPPRVALRP